MKRVRDSAILFGFAVAAVALPACPASLEDRCANDTCVPETSGGDGGDERDADVPDAPVPPDCKEDADATSPEAKGCIVDTFAVFVDGTTGDDANPGTKEKPFKKIATAIAKGPADGKRRVYICGPGPYPEHLKLTTAVHLFGGFACGTWLPDEATKAKVAPADPGYALHVDNVSAPIRFENLAFEAVAGTAASPSSIAAFVASSPSVTFKRVDFEANDGFTSPAGQAGLAGTHDVDPTGNDGTATLGGAEKMCTCSFGGTTKGGKGGDTQGTESGGTKGAPAITPPVPGSATGDGSSRAECEAGTGTGRRGSDAPAAPFQPKPALGLLDATGWHPGDGARGVNGTPGQGGGGGGSYTIGAAGQNGGGGGGACGGCGGSGGDGGKGGGASVALVSLNAPVTLKGCTLESKKAGDGAAGRDGGPGSSGGSRGNGGNTACAGGNGGNGGKGGAGAGGAGGVSAAVLYKGDAPVNDGSTLKVGSKGTGGTGGNSPDNDGPDGLEGEIVPAP